MSALLLACEAGPETGAVGLGVLLGVAGGGAEAHVLISGTIPMSMKR